MIKDLLSLNFPNWLHVAMTIYEPSSEGFGMHGSGLFIVNPPWTLPKILEESMPELTTLLALDDKASYEFASQIV